MTQHSLESAPFVLLIFTEEANAHVLSLNATMLCSPHLVVEAGQALQRSRQRLQLLRRGGNLHIRLSNTSIHSLVLFGQAIRLFLQVLVRHAHLFLTFLGQRFHRRAGCVSLFNQSLYGACRLFHLASRFRILFENRFHARRRRFSKLVQLVSRVNIRSC